MSADNEAVAWLLDILAADGGPPQPAGGDGAARLCDHAVLPPRGSGRFLVPVDSPAVAAGSISAFNRLRPRKTRLVRAALATAIRVGVARPLMKNRIRVLARADGSEELAARWLPEHLTRVLGEPKLVMASGLRPGGTFSKPVLQLFRPDGTPVGYAKVGWNDATVPRVRTEAEVLAGWQVDRTPDLSVPRLLHAGPWAGRHLSVTAPMPPGARRLRRRDGSPALASALVHHSGPTTSTTLGASAHWLALVADRDRLATTSARSATALGRVVDRIGGRHLEVDLRMGRWHGDWVSWNLARVGPQLWAWDWEYSDPAVPLGFDVVHHVFQEVFVGRGRPVAEGVAAAQAGGYEMLPRLGLAEPAIRATIALHRAEVLRRDAAAEALGAPSDRRLDPDVLGEDDR